MAIYEKFTGRDRDSFSSYEDIMANFKLSWDKDFNFAYDVVDVLGTEKPDKLAMLWISSDGEEKRFTFRDIMIYSNKAANYFKANGIGKGDPVLLVLKRSYLFWFCMMGLHKIGGIAVQATDMLTEKDYVYRCNAGKIKGVVITADGACTDNFDLGEGQYETVTCKFVTKHKKVDGWLDFEEGLENASEEWTRPTGKDAIKSTDTMLMSFSSGTTGYPKMVIHDFTYPLGHIMTGVFWHRVVDGGLHFTISDTGWLKSLWGKMYGQWFGESAVLTYDFDKFDGADILSKLEKYKVTTFCVPPTMYRMMLQNDVSKYDLSSLTHCCTAGEALNPKVFDDWKEYTGLEIYEGFGQTETTLCIATLYPFMEPIPGSIGVSVPGYEVRLLRADNEECAPGETGEICIRYPSKEKRSRGTLCEYHNNPDENAEAFHDGFYHTGDTAYMDEHGRVKYVGRNDDVIKSSGYRIGPFEVESVLVKHPAVYECAITAYPDETRGTIVKATVVLQEGYEGTAELTKELQTYVKVNTAPYKYPRKIEYVESLPKTISNKIRRVEIRQRDYDAYYANQKH